MTTPTKKIKLPISGAEIELKDWITGEEAEYIDAAVYEGIDVKPDMARKTATIGKIDAGALVNKQTHRSIEKFVVSVNGSKEKILETVRGLPETDYRTVNKEIEQRREEKKADGGDGQ